MADIYNSLRNATYSLFPKTGAWSSDAFAKGDDSLLAHLRDNEWLIKKLKNYLPNADEDTIRVFVISSEFFREQREKYEQMVVKWQIEWMVSGGENWLVSDEYGGDFIAFDPLCDIGFRKGIVDTLLAIGMDIEAIERGIEENANLWRDIYMEKAFRNKYEPVDLAIRRSESPFEPTQEGHLEKWLRLRRYQYYQEHKDSVDSYGIQKNIMDMTPEDLGELTKELALLDQERMQYLKEFKENSTVAPLEFKSYFEPDNNEDPATKEPVIQEKPRKGVKALIKRLFS